jgi:hypothetical protein
MSLCFFLTLLLPINAIPSDNFLFIPPESARTSVLILSDNPTWKKINTQDQTVCDLYPKLAGKTTTAFHPKRQHQTTK